MPIPTHVTKDNEVTNKLRHSLTNYSGYFDCNIKHRFQQFWGQNKKSGDKCEESCESVSRVKQLRNTAKLFPRRSRRHKQICRHACTHAHKAWNSLNHSEDCFPNNPQAHNCAVLLLVFVFQEKQKGGVLNGRQSAGVCPLGGAACEFKCIV